MLTALTDYSVEARDIKSLEATFSPNGKLKKLVIDECDLIKCVNPKFKKPNERNSIWRYLGRMADFITLTGFLVSKVYRDLFLTVASIALLMLGRK